MKSFFFEDQYRVIGKNETSFHVSFYDTAAEALSRASEFQSATVYRPDGTAMLVVPTAEIEVAS